MKKGLLLIIAGILTIISLTGCSKATQTNGSRAVFTDSVPEISEAQSKAVQSQQESSAESEKVETTVWYLTGTMTISEYQNLQEDEKSKPTIENGTFNISGVLAYDEKKERHFVEFFLEGDTSNALISYWADKTDNIVRADIGNADSWIINKKLTADDNDAFSFETVNRVITFDTYEYNDGKESYNIDISFRYGSAN